MRHAPLVLWPRLDPPTAALALARCCANCTAAAYALNKARMVRLAEYSRDCLTRAARRDRHRPTTSARKGTLQLFRTQKQLDGIGDGHRGAATGSACRYELLDPDGCIAAEPALGPCPASSSAACACRRRDRRLPSCSPSAWPTMAARRGRRSSATASTIQRPDAPRRAASPASRPTRAELTADAYVVALGSYSPRCCAPLGVDLPVYPVKGYSLTAADRPTRPSRRSPP